jgi:hypothetical protein
VAILTTALVVPEKIDMQDLGDKIIQLQVEANSGRHDRRIDDGDLVSAFMAVVALFAAVPVTGLPTFGKSRPDVQDLEGLIIKTFKAVNTHNGH